MSAETLKALRSRIRKQLTTLRGGRRRRYPPPLRRLIGRYAAARIMQGAGRRRVTAEIGVSDPTLVKILDESKVAMRPVRVTPEPAAPAAGGAPAPVVRGPGGLVIEGLDLDGIAALVRALS